MSEALGEVPVANPGVTAIIRCKRCRTYMNPFMAWTDGGRCVLGGGGRGGSGGDGEEFGGGDFPGGQQLRGG